MRKFSDFLYLFILVLASCNENRLVRTNDKKEIEIQLLKLKIPSTYQFIKGSGVDSYVAYIVNQNMDTFQIEYGSSKVIYDLFDVSPKGMLFDNKESLSNFFGNNPEKEGIIFTNTPEKDNEQNIFDLNFYLYDTINSIIVKIVEPKRIGHGTTGMYIPELKDGNSFSIYARNLDALSHEECLEMFKTVSYK